MSKLNPLAGLIGNYDDSDEESDDAISSVTNMGRSIELPPRTNMMANHAVQLPEQPPGIHPAPITHCRKFHFIIYIFYRLFVHFWVY